MIRRFLGRGVFPARFAWFLQGPWRRWVLSPEQLAARLPLTPGLTLCDIGVGGGYYARPLAASVRHLIGLDLQMEMLAQVRPTSGAPNLLLLQGDASHLPLATSSIDMVIAVTVLGEVPSAEAAIAECVRVLRPGGLLSISEHLPDPDYLSFELVQRLCADQGLRLDARYGHRWSYTANFRLKAS